MFYGATVTSRLGRERRMKLLAVREVLRSLTARQMPAGVVLSYGLANRMEMKLCPNTGE